MRHALSAALLAASCTIPALAAQTVTAAPAGTSVSIGKPLALTFYISPANPAAAEAKAKSLQTQGSSDYHQFLTLQQFVRDYAVSDAVLKSIETSLKSLGYTIAYVYPNHLAIEVTVPVSTAQNTLGIKLRALTKDGKIGFAPDRPFTLPAVLKSKGVRGVGGLNTVSHPHPMIAKSMIPGQSTKRAVTPAMTLQGGAPGDYLPADFAAYYHVNPLYNQGFTGRGRTVGIVTLNNFDTADAFSFWKGIGLNVSSNRITKVNVDGGFTAPSNNPGGEGETDLDVEYSGALAPQSNVRVYIAPNTSSADFINGFEAAASENVADTISTSWGQPELDFFPDLAPYAYPSQTYILDEFHDVFLEMALQGQTVFVASGDSGAFDTVRGCPAFGTASPYSPVCNAPYTVDHPSSDPLVTAAGGTTLPFDFTLSNGLRIRDNYERAWAWDYIVSQAAQQGFGGVYTLPDFFSVGGGGGVSAYFPLPWYQSGTPGINKTVPAQYFSVDLGSGSAVEVVLPSQFAGRNTPDLSTNADPESGYQLISRGQVEDFNGGTSFVAPQLNGVTALLAEALGGRVGQLNPALYKLGQVASPDLTAGNNWGFPAGAGFDNATGVGKLDGAKLLKGLQQLGKDRQ